jgi:ionotropic glutamate receptor
MPYTQYGVSLLVLSESDLEPIQWTFLAPLTKELWLATVGFFFLQ